MLRLLAATLLAVLIPAGAAAAASELRATPDTPGAGTELRLFTDAAELGNRIPTALFLRLARGFELDPRAVAGRCSDDQATKAACPVESRVGRGAATVNASTAFGSQDYRATLGLYAADPIQAGDLAAVVVTVEFQNERRSAKGRVVRVAEGAYGIEVRFEQFPKVEVPPGITLRLKSMELDTGASRTERVLVKCKRRSKTCRPKNGCRRTPTRRCLFKTHAVRRDLLTTPRTCAGTWPAQAEARFEDGSSAFIDAPIPCRDA